MVESPKYELQLDKDEAAAFVAENYVRMVTLFRGLHEGLARSTEPHPLGAELAFAAGEMYGLLLRLAPDVCTSCGARFNAHGNLGDNYFLCSACGAELSAAIRTITEPTTIRELLELPKDES